MEKLPKFAERAERSYQPDKDAFDKIVEHQNRDSDKFEGRITLSKPKQNDSQLGLFDWFLRIIVRSSHK